MFLTCVSAVLHVQVVLTFATLTVASSIAIVGEKLISPYTLYTTAERMTPCNTRANLVELCCALGDWIRFIPLPDSFTYGVKYFLLDLFSSSPSPSLLFCHWHVVSSLSFLSLHPFAFSPSVSLRLSDSSISELQPPVQEWVISSKLIWPLMIGSGTYSSVSDWPRDAEANFPWCSWRIVVALNYHLLCVCVCSTRACTVTACVCKCLHKCLRVWKELVDWQ